MAIRWRMLPLPRGSDGLPRATAREARVAWWVAAIATAWFAAAACWELFGPLLAGHYASSASVGIAAENMWRWKIAGPVLEYTAARPDPSQYYSHHPWGIFWTEAFFMKIFGRHDFVCRLPAVLLSVMTPPLLHAIGRSVWRPAAGAAAAASFVVLPIALAFSNFNALEVPVIAFSLLAIWGYVRLTQTWRRRYLVASAAGFFLALNADWPAFVLAAEMLAFGLWRGIFGGARLPRAAARRYAQWWALTALLSVATLALYVVLFQKSGKLTELLGAYGMRSSGNKQPLAAVLASRRYWIELSFTPIAILLGKVAAALAVLRCLVLRREHEVLPLWLLGMAAFQYVVFKQGADIHVFWPHYFGPYFALSMGLLVATLAPIVSAASARLRALRRPRAPLSPPSGAAELDAGGALFALGAALWVVVAIARDGIPALRYARETGGRFNEKGLIIESDGAKTAALAWLLPRMRPDRIVDMHEGMKTSWSQMWTLGGRVVSANRAPPRGPGHDGRDTYLADTRYLLDEVQGDLADRFQVTAVGPFWMIARNARRGPLEAFSFIEREPSLLEYLFVSGTEPHREIAADPFLTWELRVHFAQAVEPPVEAPRTLDQRRIVHNIAVWRGDNEAAAAQRAAIEAELTPVRAAFDDGTTILGTTFREGAQDVLTIYVEAAGPARADVQLGVKSKVTAPAWLSTTMADPTEREVGTPLSIAPQRWRKGFLYADPVVIVKRPGVEVFRAYFWARARGTPPRRADGGPEAVEVLTLR